MPLWLLAFPEVIPHRFVIVLAVGGTVVGGILAFSGPPVYAGGRRDWPDHRRYYAVSSDDPNCFAHIARATRPPRTGAGRDIFVTLGYFRFRVASSGQMGCPPILVVLFAIASAVALTYGHDASRLVGQRPDWCLAVSCGIDLEPRSLDVSVRRWLALRFDLDPAAGGPWRSARSITTSFIS